MKRYFFIYATLLKLNFSNLTAFRANLLNHFLSASLWGSFQIVTIIILTSRIKSIFGWERSELILLVAVFNIFIGIYHTFFSSNFERFTEIIHLGQMDSILVKPADSQFLMTTWIISYPSLLRVLIGAAITIYLAINFGIRINAINILGFILVIPISLMTLYSIWFLISTITIWFTKLSNLMEFMFKLSSFTRFPKEMFDHIKNLLIYIILPLTLIVSTPTKILLGKPFLNELILLILVAIFLFFLSRSFWKFALRFYTSASS